MKRGVFAFGMVTVLFLVSACSTIEECEVGYLTPGSDVSLKKDPVVNVVSLGETGIVSSIAEAIKKDFAESDQFVLSEESPDYLIFLSGEEEYRKDSKDEQTFNKIVTKITEKTDTGSTEKILVENHATSAFSGVVSVAVYSVKDLSPIYYYDISMYDSEFKSQSDGVRENEDYDKELFKQITEKIEDSFRIQKRGSNTVFPKKRGNAELKRLVKAGKSKEAIELGKKVVSLDFDAFMQNIKGGKYAEGDKWYSSENDIIEEMLCNYYLIAIAEEIDDYSNKNLKRLHARHLAILNQTEDDALEIACPNSLARIESKLKQNTASVR